MSEENTEKKDVTPASEETTKENTEPSHDPVKEELEREQRKGSGKTELEKALFTKQQIEKRIAELRGESGAPVTVSPDKDAPLTIGMYEQMQRENAQKTALQLAEEITDQNERELTKHYLQTRVVPTGNPQEDLRFARAAVNSVRNGMMAEELSRKTTPSAPAFSGAPAKRDDTEFVPTAEEADMMRSFKLTKEDILNARKQQAALEK